MDTCYACGYVVPVAHRVSYVSFGVTRVLHLLCADRAGLVCDACNSDAGEPCRPYCVGAAAAADTAGGKR